jgi:hypothetical protein
MRLTHSTNLSAVQAALSKTEREQIPFATALALTKTAQKVKAGEIAVMKRNLDRPTNFTLNSLFVKAATKATQQARVWFKDFAPKGTPAGDYLQPQVQGGQRKLKRHEKALIARGLMKSTQYAVPAAGAKLDQYGNMKRTQYVQLLSQLRAFGEQGYSANATGSKRSTRKRRSGAYFVATINGEQGVWQEVQSAFGAGARPVLLFVDRDPSYRVRFPFFKIAENMVKSNYEREFKAALDTAIKTRLGAI